MSDATPQTTQQHFADLDALHRQLEEMAVRTKRLGTGREQRQFEEPLLVIRGK